MLDDSNRVINSLWIGSELSDIELLTIHSFLRHGHHFHLWTYESITTSLPDGVVICDANSIVSSDSVFRYKHANKWGHGKGSVAGFSDIFRYKLLFLQGGWWVDMDVTCLKPFDTKEPYFFRSHHQLALVGNVMKCPLGSELMLKCYEDAVVSVTEDSTDWHKPIDILARYVKELKLTGYIQSGMCNKDIWGQVKRYIFMRCKIPENYICLHWMNEEWRSRSLKVELILPDSSLGELLRDYEISSPERIPELTLANRFAFFLSYLFK